jgi:hypothetical protein
VQRVLDHVTRENKATGHDGISVTLWKRIPAAREILMNLVCLMWTYEVVADDCLLVMQLMIHKPGKPWTKRSAFRPISLCNDIYMNFDFAMGRSSVQTGWAGRAPRGAPHSSAHATIVASCDTRCGHR